jgi:restriction system protein
MWRPRSSYRAYAPHAVHAATMYYFAPFVPVEGKLWTPEQELPVEDHRIITPQEFRAAPAIIRVDARLLQLLDRQPERLLSLDWREFEKIVAVLLEGFGYQTVLSPIGRDGGIDITAHRKTDLGSELVVVQCKRYGSKKVGEPAIKQFCVEIDDRKATRGLVVTTSAFTSAALKYIESKKFKVAGADRQKLQEWIRGATRSGPS